MNVVIINGPMGVGKTTVGKYIADLHPGTAFIDGDWCLDLHPFVGDQETKAMAVDNILHMIKNYKNCSVCQMIVLVWLIYITFSSISNFWFSAFWLQKEINIFV